MNNAITGHEQYLSGAYAEFQQHLQWLYLDLGAINTTLADHLKCEGVRKYTKSVATPL